MKPNFQLELKGVASKKIYLIQKNIGSVVVPLIDANTTLRQLLFESNKISTPANNLAIITLKRDGQAFQMTGEQILDPKNPDISVADEDHIEIEYLAYKPAQVFALSGAGRAEMVTIDPSRRETLADILFTPKGALNSLVAKLSEVYLLRGQDPSVAYHLDAQNVSRILVAAKTELRPNDIVYVADRPIISFSRTLAEINPLRILLRDLQNGNIP
jgi:polysaccharide export outer membrane protein